MKISWPDNDCQLPRKDSASWSLFVFFVNRCRVARRKEHATMTVAYFVLGRA